MTPPSASPLSRLAGRAPRIAVIVPCYNEAVAIPKVVADFRAALPDAAIYVYDNNSRDGTVAAARAAGAIVRRETLQGKGNVIRRAFADVDAELYVLVDGDDTYDAAAAPAMVELLLRDGLDMVNGARVTDIAKAYRPGHRLGNLVLTGMVRAVFGDRISDMLSGYRVFSRRFVKSFPALAGGFETETEFTVPSWAISAKTVKGSGRRCTLPPSSSMPMKGGTPWPRSQSSSVRSMIWSRVSRLRLKRT